MEEMIMKTQKKSHFKEDWLEALRNQLNIINTSIFLMEKAIANNNTADHIRYLQKMREAMERIKIIIE